MPLLSLISDFVADLSEKWLIKGLAEKSKEYFGDLFKSNRSKCLKQLKSSIKMMPFLYKENENDVLEDFVEVITRMVDTIKLEPIIKNNTSAGSLVQPTKFKDNQKILIIGNAGVGKTTLFRHTILSIIDKKPTPYYSIENKNVYPIFISLKIVKNTRESPILHYIFENDPFFKEENSVDKFRSWAKKRKIFLALDGYDEIGFAAKENYINNELNVLINSNASYNAIDPNLKDIYEALTICKVWLSTRQNFYRRYPIINTVISDFKYIPQNTFSAIEITGLGQKRFSFIKRIFDKYREKAAIFREFMDEEQFLEVIDTTHDKRLIEFSHVPLFLSIMCYVYANKIEKKKTVINNWLTNFDELVNECVHVLLDDLDTYKVRNFTEVQREAFKNRRNNYTDEKIRFLQYFSLHLLIDGLNVFTEDYIQKKVIDFFSNRLKAEPNAIGILQEFETPNSNNPNFTVQLIISGLFLIQGTEQAQIQYDFPHRRFKEVLAIESLNDEHNMNLLCANISNDNLSELIQLTFNNSTNLRPKLFTLFLENLKSSNNIHLNKLLGFCLRETRELDNELTEIFEFFLMKVIGSGQPVYVNKELFKKINFTWGFKLYLSNILNNLENDETTLFAYEILREVDFPEFLKIITEGFLKILSERNSSNDSNVILKLFLNELFQATTKINISGLEPLLYSDYYYRKVLQILGFKFKNINHQDADILNEKMIMILLFAVASSRYYFTNIKTSFGNLFELKLRHKIIFMAFLKLYNFQAYETLSSISDYRDLILIYEDFFLKRRLFNDINSFSKILQQNQTDLIILKKEEYDFVINELKSILAASYSPLLDCIY